MGSDGRFSFWDKDARTKLKTSEQLDQPISACCFNHNGNIFAYASSYDWSKVRIPKPALGPVRQQSQALESEGLGLSREASQTRCVSANGMSPSPHCKGKQGLPLMLSLRTCPRQELGQRKPSGRHSGGSESSSDARGCWARVKRAQQGRGASTRGIGSLLVCCVGRREVRD